MNTLTDFLGHILRMFADRPLGAILLILLIGAGVIVIGVIAYGFFVAIDSWFLPRRRKTGRVVSKTFTPAHIAIIPIYDATLKIVLPHQIFHPDDWSLSVAVDGKRDSVSISKDFFDSLSENDSVLTEYVSGRFSGSLHIKALSRKSACRHQ